MNDTAKKATIWVVLILVLMEKGGSDECRPRRYLSPRVLILVLMEKGGSRMMKEFFVNWVMGLNPCFNGKRRIW